MRAFFDEFITKIYGRKTNYIHAYRPPNLKKFFSISLGKRVFFSFLDQGLFSGANFVLNLILARWLPNEEYGAFSVAFSIFLLLAGFQTALILEPMAVFGPTHHSKNLEEYIGKVTIYQFIFTALLSSILAIGALFFHSIVRNSLLGLAVSMPFILLYWLMRQASYVRSHSEMAAQGSIVYAVCLIIGAVILYQNQWLSPLTAFVLMGVCGTVSSLILIRLLKVKINVSISLSVIYENWGYGKWIIVASIAAWIIAWIYPPLISAFTGLAQAGAFKAMQNLILPLQQGLAAITLFILPLFSRQYHENGIKYLSKNVNLIIALGLLISGIYTILLVVSGPLVVNIVYLSQDYKETVWLLPYLGLSVVLFIPGQFMGLTFRAMGQSSKIFWTKAISALFILTFGILAIISNGLMGVAFCLILGSLVETIACLYLYIKNLRKAYANENI